MDYLNNLMEVPVNALQLEIDPLLSLVVHQLFLFNDFVDIPFLFTVLRMHGEFTLCWDIILWIGSLHFLYFFTSAD